jgi:hypothetical protein
MRRETANRRHRFARQLQVYCARSQLLLQQSLFAVQVSPDAMHPASPELAASLFGVASRGALAESEAAPPSLPDVASPPVPVSAELPESPCELASDPVEPPSLPGAGPMELVDEQPTTKKAIAQSVSRMESSRRSVEVCRGRKRSQPSP